VLFLKFDLACETHTVEGIGSSLACAINRSSIYLLLTIMIALCCMTLDLYLTLKDPLAPAGQRKRVLTLCSTATPSILLTLAYVFDSKDSMEQRGVPNGILNVARHSFSCSMRFSDMATEWALLWVHFAWSGLGVLLFTYLSLMQIEKKTASLIRHTSIDLRGPRSNISVRIGHVKTQERRLFRIALYCSGCLLLNMVIAIVISGTGISY
jgi:hypothetical protein